MAEQRCTYLQEDGFHHCGSYQFNLLNSQGIEQGTPCDVHYWKAEAQQQAKRAEEAEAKLADAETSGAQEERKRLAPFIRHMESCPSRGFSDGRKAMEFCKCGLRAALRNEQGAAPQGSAGTNG